MLPFPLPLARVDEDENGDCRVCGKGHVRRPCIWQFPWTAAARQSKHAWEEHARRFPHLPTAKFKPFTVLHSGKVQFRASGEVWAARFCKAAAAAGEGAGGRGPQGTPRAAAPAQQQQQQEQQPAAAVERPADARAASPWRRERARTASPHKLVPEEDGVLGAGISLPSAALEAYPPWVLA